MIDPCHALNQQQHCNIANGQPSEVFTQIGYTGTDDDVAPENNITGLALGLHQFWRESTGKMYVFNGTVGTSVGWVILN